MAFCFEKGHSPNTTSIDIARINYFYKHNGFYTYSNSSAINKLLERCRRGRHRHDIRAPLTMHISIIVCGILSKVCYSTPMPVDYLPHSANEPMLCYLLSITVNILSLFLLNNEYSCPLICSTMPSLGGCGFTRSTVAVAPFERIVYDFIIFMF